MNCSPVELKTKGDEFVAKWQLFKRNPGFDGFVEFAVSVSGFTEFLDAKGLGGLHQSAHALEQNVLALFDQEAGPMPAPALQELDQKIVDLSARIATFLQGSATAIVERRMRVETGAVADVLGSKLIWFFTSQPEAWKDIVIQAGYFNIQVQMCSLLSEPTATREPVIVLVDALDVDFAQYNAALHTLRDQFSSSSILGLNLASNFEVLNAALVAGCDYCFPVGTVQSTIMARIVKLCGNEEEEPYRVLVVEDSKTATALIQRTLKEAGMDSLAIAKPQEVLTSLVKFKPDLVLMDMFMPGCTGVEVTRVIRQHEEFLSTPVVYLSGDSSIGLQVDALRLGGDHFLTKPFNPVILNAVVKSKIDRYRMLRRSMTLDSLTGLLNHLTSKQRLDAAVAAARSEGTALSAAMVDIDFFKKVNDGYGHPMGDQVIRSLAWLLRQRLRKTDAVGRYGGEEFLVILPNANAQQAHQLLDRIRVDFSQFHHALPEGSFSCTFSGGICQLAPDLQGSSMIKRADEGLYVAKRQGRNQIVI